MANPKESSEKNDFNKLERISPEDLVRRSESIEDLKKAIELVGTVKGSKKEYAAQEVNQTISNLYEIVKNKGGRSAARANSGFLTNALGIRKRFIELVDAKYPEEDGNPEPLAPEGGPGGGAPSESGPEVEKSPDERVNMPAGFFELKKVREGLKMRFEQSVRRARDLEQLYGALKTLGPVESSGVPFEAEEVIGKIQGLENRIKSGEDLTEESLVLELQTIPRAGELDIREKAADLLKVLLVKELLKEAA